MTVPLETLIQVFPVQIPPGFVPHPGGPTVPQGSRLCDSPPYQPTFGAGVNEIHRGRRHDAVDIAAAYGAPVVSVCDGTVFTDWVYEGHPRPGADSLPAVAGYVRVCGPENTVLYYAHMMPICVGPGDAVHTGQVIGFVYHAGTRGGSAHLHFQIRAADARGSARGGRRIDPTLRLRALHAAGGWRGSAGLALSCPAA